MRWRRRRAEFFLSHFPLRRSFCFLKEKKKERKGRGERGKKRGKKGEVSGTALTTLRVPELITRYLPQLAKRRKKKEEKKGRKMRHASLL